MIGIVLRSLWMRFVLLARCDGTMTDAKRTNKRLSKAVVETFCTLHSEGLIYRANRLVNWCVYLNTTLSNIEVRVPLPHRQI
jgi:valyl-tRNA synthetase